MASRNECTPDKSRDQYSVAGIVGDSLVAKQNDPGRLHETINGLNATSGPQALAELKTYLNKNCHSDIADQIMPKAKTGAEAFEFHTASAADSSQQLSGATDKLDDPRNALYNRGPQMTPEGDGDKQSAMRDRFDHHAPRTNLQGSLAASLSGDVISSTLDKDARFQKTGDLNKDEQNAIFDRMDPARYKTALTSLEQSANKNLANQQYHLSLHREFDKDGKGTEVIDVIDAKTQAAMRTYQREQRPVNPALHVSD